MPDQQGLLFSSSSSPSLGDGGPSTNGSNGFDFGLSQPKSGLGYGLLGDTPSLASAQDCADCAPNSPCPSCGDSSGVVPYSDGQIIKAQLPLTGLLPPPPVGAVPSSPSKPPILGDPNAWWNRGDADLRDWINGIFHAQSSPEVEQMCEEQYDRDIINCKINKAIYGGRSAATCYAQAMEDYSKCLKTGKGSL